MLPTECPPGLRLTDTNPNRVGSATRYDRRKCGLSQGNAERREAMLARERQARRPVRGRPQHLHRSLGVMAQRMLHAQDLTTVNQFLQLRITCI